MKLFSRLMAGLIGLAVSVPVNAQTDSLAADTLPLENRLLWEISGKGIKQPSYLLGTMHLLNGSDLKNIPGAADAFEKSGRLVLEMLQQEEDAAIIQALARLPEGITFRQFFDTAELQEIHDELKRYYPVGVEAIENTPPFVIQIGLSYQYLLDAGGTPPDGETPMEAWLRDQAAERNIPMQGFEKASAQVELMSKIGSYEDQSRQLMDMIRNREKYKTELLGMLRDYHNGNINRLYAETIRSMEMMNQPDLFLFNRNRDWLQQLPNILQQGNAFIAVGAAHLGGRQGLIEGLRQQGYSVKPAVR